MNNDELKKKIVDIALHAEWTDIFGDHNSIGKYAANAIADALIAAGIGDVETVQNISASATAMAVLEAAQAEHRAEVYKRALHIAHTAGEFAYYVDKAEKELAEENSGKKKI